VGKNGHVSSTPQRISKNDATIECEKTKRVKAVFHQDGIIVEIFKTCEFQKVSDSFRLLFGSLSIEDYNNRW
jgi:hypothetical protein